ncbi:MAG: GNAT family N-acetyltransferase, partial [Allosphingosinicella sp.]
MPVILRPEQPADRAAIAALVEHAFGQPDEARLIARLRADGDLVLSLVADDGGTILGHVALSLMAAPFRALGLAPVAVAPGHQRQGIAAALIREALDRARADGWGGVFVLGDPAYYRRFGFSPDLASGFDSPYAGRYL